MRHIVYMKPVGYRYMSVVVYIRLSTATYLNPNPESR